MCVHARVCQSPKKFGFTNMLILHMACIQFSIHVIEMNYFLFIWIIYFELFEAFNVCVIRILTQPNECEKWATHCGWGAAQRHAQATPEGCEPKTRLQLQRHFSTSCRFFLFAHLLCLLYWHVSLTFAGRNSMQKKKESAKTCERKKTNLNLLPT